MILGSFLKTHCSFIGYLKILCKSHLGRSENRFFFIFYIKHPFWVTQLSSKVHWFWSRISFHDIQTVPIASNVILPPLKPTSGLLPVWPSDFSLGCYRKLHTTVLIHDSEYTLETFFVIPGSIATQQTGLIRLCKQFNLSRSPLQLTALL